MGRFSLAVPQLLALASSRLGWVSRIFGTGPSRVSKHPNVSLGEIRDHNKMVDAVAEGKVAGPIVVHIEGGTHVGRRGDWGSRFRFGLH